MGKYLLVLRSTHSFAYTTYGWSKGYAYFLTSNPDRPLAVQEVVRGRGVIFQLTYNIENLEQVDLTPRLNSIRVICGQCEVLDVNITSMDSCSRTAGEGLWYKLFALRPDLCLPVACKLLMTFCWHFWA